MKGYKNGLMLWKDPKAMRDLAESRKDGKKICSESSCEAVD